MIGWLEEYLRERWDILGWKPRPPAEFAFLVQSRRRVIVFVLDKDERELGLVAKLSRDPSSARRTHQEAKILQVLGEILPDGLKQTVPRVIHLEEFCGRLLGFEGPLSGRPMPLLVRDGAIPQYADPFYAVYRWLMDFQSHGITGNLCLAPLTLQARLIQPVQSSLEAAGMDHPVLQKSVDQAHSLEGLTLPTLFCHGDLHPSNVLLSGGRVSGVVDWETAHTDSLPFYDWFQFVFEHRLEATRRRHPTWQRDRLLGSVVRQILPREGPQTGIDAWTVRFLACYGVSATVVPFLWLWFASQVVWPGDRSELVRICAQAIIENRSGPAQRHSPDPAASGLGQPLPAAGDGVVTDVSCEDAMPGVVPID
jgi:hypothetical protein